MHLGLFFIRCSSVLDSNLPLFVLKMTLQLVIPNLSSYVPWAIMDFTLCPSTSQTTAGSFLDSRKTPNYCQTLLYLISESTPSFRLVGRQDRHNCRLWPNANSMRPLFSYGLHGRTFRQCVLNFLKISNT